jgi:hypothetical protein
MSAAPRTEPVADAGPRPFWSVMVTHYDRATYLERALRSVLEQDPGPAEMEIVVVDDASPTVDPEPLVRAVGGGRVSLYRRAVNGGLAETWNSCIRRARGRWIHILHDDDAVRPGFYAALRAGIEGAGDRRPGAAFSRVLTIDADDHWLGISEIERRTPGILEDWLPNLAVAQRVQCAAMVVERATYEALGGFRPELVYALDWEMWVRIASRYDVWYEPRPLACYRAHGGSESTRLSRQRSTLADERRAIELFREHLPPARADALVRAARQTLATRQIRRALVAVEHDDLRGAAANIRDALSLSPSAATARHLVRFAIQAGLQGVRRVVRGPMTSPRPSGA